MPARPSVTARALALLAAFDPEHRRLSLTELSDRAGLPVATAHRLCGELTRWGALQRGPDGRYGVGERLWSLGLLAPVQTDLRACASPFLHDLFAATQATVHLAVRDGLETLYVDRLAGHASVPILSTVGSRLPLHATAVGKVLLAHAPPEVRAQALRQPVRVTAYTVVNPAVLARQLHRVRRDGYATTAEEMSLGTHSVAVPVEDPAGVVAALGIVVPHLRQDRARLVAALTVAARGISRQLRTDPGPSR